MKNSKILILCLVITTFFSCNKEELSTPLDDANQDELKSAKLSSSIGYTLILENNNAAFENLDPNATVAFKGMLWSVTHKDLGSRRAESQVWSSFDGKTWSLRRTNQFTSRFAHSLITYKNKLWLIGGVINDGPKSGEFSREVWNSIDGLKWEHVNRKIPTPFSDTSRSGAVVFNKRMFVFEFNYGERQKVYSSSNGINWTLENRSAFPGRTSGKSIVFNKELYFIGGFDPYTGKAYNSIWKSSNGRDWQLTNRLHVVNRMFSSRWGHSAVVFENKVWLIGGKGYSSDPTNEIWYSSNMREWDKYEVRHFGFSPLYDHTTVTFNNKIYILGGLKGTSPSYEPSTKIWSIGLGQSFN